jgi:hypothetical protein
MKPPTKTVVAEPPPAMRTVTPSNAGRSIEVVAMFARTKRVWEDKDMKVQLFRTTSTCLISEHIITDRVGIKEVDTTKQQDLRFTREEVKTLGQLTIFICLGTPRELRWRKVTFEVLPNSFVRNRFDSVLSDEAISAFDEGYIEEAIEHAKQ